MLVLVTGVAGFIGYHVAAALLARGDTVIGIDNLNEYYSVALKRARLAQLQVLPGFTFHQADIGDPKPSTGNEKGNDDYAANQIGKPIYTVTRHAIWRQDPQKKDPVQAGEDGWWKVSAQKEKNKELKCP